MPLKTKQQEFLDRKMMEFDKAYQFAVKYKTRSTEIVDFDYHAEELEKCRNFLRKAIVDSFGIK